MNDDGDRRERATRFGDSNRNNAMAAAEEEWK